MTFSTLSSYTHTKKTGLDSVVLKVCKKTFYTYGLRGQYDPTLKMNGKCDFSSFFLFICQKTSIDLA